MDQQITGKTNEALEIRLEEIDGDTLTQKKTEKELEVEKEHYNSAIVSTIPEQHSSTLGDDSEPSMSGESDDAPSFACSTVGVHLEKFWSFLADYVVDNWSQFKIFVYLTLAALYNTYFVACIYHAHTNGAVIDWCDGVGLLILLTSVTYAGLFYYQVVKRFWGRAIYKKALLPIRRSLGRVWVYRWSRVTFYFLIVGALVVFLVLDTADERERLISFIGLLSLILFGWIFSRSPSKVIWRQVIWGTALQFIFGLIVLRWPTGRHIFQCLGDKIATFLNYSDAGSGFAYGYLVSDQNLAGIKLGTVLVFKALSVVFFFSFVISILYYYGIMQAIIQKLGWFLQISVGTTAAESMVAATNIFLGQSEAPLVIKPFLPKMTRSELHAVMTGGYATVAGGSLAAYISFGISPVHLLSASMMSAPAALAFSKLFYPETEVSRTKAKDIKLPKGTESNVLDAAAQGAVNSVFLVLNITANMVAFLAFIAFLNGALSWFGNLLGAPYLTFDYIMGKVFVPLAWLMGVPTSECEMVANLVAVKTVVSEFVAYNKLSEYVAKGLISKRSEVIATYALCGFSNPGSIGCQIGALTSIAPSKQSDVAQVALRAFVAGCVACFMTACVAGTLISSN